MEMVTAIKPVKDVLSYSFTYYISASINSATWIFIFLKKSRLYFSEISESQSSCIYLENLINKLCLFWTIYNAKYKCIFKIHTRYKIE